jgi:CRISPR associated protein Cas2
VGLRLQAEILFREADNDRRRRRPDPSGGIATSGLRPSGSEGTDTRAAALWTAAAVSVVTTPASRSRPGSIPRASGQSPVLGLECRLDSRQPDNLARRLRQLIDESKDSVRIYRICQERHERRQSSGPASCPRIPTFTSYNQGPEHASCEVDVAKLAPK